MALRSTAEDQTKKPTSYRARFMRTCSRHLLPRVLELGKTSMQGAACQGAAAGPGLALSEVTEKASSLREKSTRAVLDLEIGSRERASAPLLVAGRES